MQQTKIPTTDKFDQQLYTDLPKRKQSKAHEGGNIKAKSRF